MFFVLIYCLLYAPYITEFRKFIITGEILLVGGVQMFICQAIKEISENTLEIGCAILVCSCKIADKCLICRSISIRQIT